MKDHGKLSKTEKILHVFISLPTEDVCGLRDINTGMLVHQFKSKVELKVGIPGDLIHLFFMNKELLDDRPLYEYKLKHGCILRVRLHKTWMGLVLSCWKGDPYEVFNNGVRKMDGDLHSLESDIELWNELVVKRATFALFMATHRGYISLMLELLKSSAADINGSTVFGRTSLHIASFQGFVGCVSLLLSEGAVSNTTDVFGKTPLQLAHVNRHIYCQKRLYLHQTSSYEVLKGHRKRGDGTELSAFTVPQRSVKAKVINDLKMTCKTKSDKTSDQTQSASTPAEGPVFPSISVISKDQSPSAPDPCGIRSSYGLPEMEMIEYPKTIQPGVDKSSADPFPELRSFASSTAQPKHSPSPKGNIPKGIRRLEQIFKTSQDDIVGEYHNVEESTANVSVTTLKFSLPREDVGEDDGGNQGISETPPRIDDQLRNRRILGFVLKAEEKSHREEQPEQPESETLNRFGPEIQDVSDQSHPEISHLRVRSSLSFDEWLEKKRESEKHSMSERPRSATTVRTKVGREMSVEAFQKWLKDKKKIRQRRASESSSTVQRNKSGSGVSFEMWLCQKRQQGESFSESSGCEDITTVTPDPRLKATNFGGKTFTEWLSEKRKVQPVGDSLVHFDRQDNRSRSGKSFREWLKDKRKQKQKDLVLRETLETEKLKKKAVLEEQRLLNPRVRTFDQWFEEKRVQKLIQYIQSRNMPDQPTLLNCKTKFPEDAKLVFDMWLTSKHVEELSKEERRYEEMKEKWKKKEQERLQVRKGILQKLHHMNNENK